MAKPKFHAGTGDLKRVDGGGEKRGKGKIKSKESMPKLSEADQKSLDEAVNAEKLREKAALQKRTEEREVAELAAAKKAEKVATRDPHAFGMGLSVPEGDAPDKEVTLSVTGSDGEAIDLKEYLPELKEYKIHVSNTDQFHFKEKDKDVENDSAILYIPKRLLADVGGESPRGAEASKRLMEIVEAVVGKEKNKAADEARQKLKDGLPEIFEGHHHDPPVRWADKIEHAAVDFPDKELFWDKKAKEYKKLEDAVYKADDEREKFVTAKMKAFADALKRMENVDLGDVAARPVGTDYVFSGPGSEDRGAMETNSMVRGKIVDDIWDRADAAGSKSFLPRMYRNARRFNKKHLVVPAKVVAATALGAPLMVAGIGAWNMGGRWLYKKLSGFFRDVVGPEDHPHSHVPVVGGLIDWVEGGMRWLSDEALPPLDEKGGGGGHGGGH